MKEEEEEEEEEENLDELLERSQILMPHWPLGDAEEHPCPQSPLLQYGLQQSIG